jgi:STE24 endopeptidase
LNEDKSARYHRQKRRCEVAAVAIELGMLTALVATPAGRAWADLARAVAARWVTGVAGDVLGATGFVLGLVIAFEVVAAPFAVVGGWILERRYELSTESLGSWVRDRAKAIGIRAALALAASQAVLLAMAAWPRGWWMAAAAGFAAVAIVLAYLAPVVLMPVFFRFRPLENDALRSRLLVLAERAGTRVFGVYEWFLGDRTRKANAALVGLHRTRRVLLSDTLLAGYSDDEIEVVLAHELAHHVHRDIHKALLFEIATVTAGLAIAAGVLRMGGIFPGAGATGPLVALLGTSLVMAAWSVLLSPLAHAISRRHERRADRFALDLTRNPDAFVSAMRRLGSQNLAEEAPSTLVQWLFYTHPPMRERIQAARSWRTNRVIESLIP